MVFLSVKQDEVAVKMRRQVGGAVVGAIEKPELHEHDHYGKCDRHHGQKEPGWFVD